MLEINFLSMPKPQSYEITQSGNMGRKTPISLNSQKYVEMHCNGPY